MTTLVQFSKNIRKRGRAIENNASELTRRMAKQSLRALVTNTRVDTGEARSNWRVGAGSPPTAIIKPYNPYPKGSKANGQGMAENANLAAALSVGFAKIDSIKGKAGIGLTTAIYIVNNTPQAYFMSAGGANLAPSNFVEQATAAARSALRGFRITETRPQSGGE